MDKFILAKPDISFNPEEDEILIDFVKSNEILYNCKLQEYKNSFAKNKLWQLIGQ